MIEVVNDNANYTYIWKYPEDKRWQSSSFNGDLQGAIYSLSFFLQSTALAGLFPIVQLVRVG